MNQTLQATLGAQGKSHGYGGFGFIYCSDPLKFEGILRFPLEKTLKNL
ncbi:MAG: hypothetical protein AB7E10_08110 [Burkholderiaceae bacterium]